MRKYTAAQIIGFVLSFFIPPIAVWFTEGFGVDFWINVILCLLGYFPGSIHATYIWIVWIERKWQTHHGREVTDHPFLIFSKEFEVRSRWKGNGQDGFFGYFDDNIKGGHGHNVVGGDVDPEQAMNLPTNPHPHQNIIVEPQMQSHQGHLVADPKVQYQQEPVVADSKAQYHQEPPVVDPKIQ